MERTLVYWIHIDDKYLDYLRSIEKRIPFSDYGSDKMKPFFGVLFETDDFAYVTQVSHPQPRHSKLKQARDFYKLYDDDRLIGVVNLNYMFPMLIKDVKRLNMSELDEVRTFSSKQEKSKYINLLNKELEEINRLPIEKNSKYIYELKSKYPESAIAKRCFDFKALEEKAKEWH